MFRYLNIKLNNISIGRYSWGGGTPLYFVTPAYNPQVYAGYNSVWARFPNSVCGNVYLEMGAWGSRQASSILVITLPQAPEQYVSAF